MKTLNLLLATLLWVTLCTGFYSCDDGTIDGLGEETIRVETIYDGYLNYEDYECLGGIQLNKDGRLLISGLKNKHIWLGVFEYGGSKTKLYEWIDPETTNKKQNLYIGYGEYKELSLYSIGLSELEEVETSGFISRSLLRYGEKLEDSRIKWMLIFKSPNKTKKIYSDWVTTTKFEPMRKWYESSWIIDGCCYDSKGDTIFIPKTIPNAIDNPVSYKEGIYIDGLTITRINYEDNKVIWQSEVTPPFQVASNCRYTFTLQDSSTQNWKYKVDVTYYDGTKKDFTFNINIETGTIIGEELPISYANLKGTWDMTKCYGWEYNGDGVKEDWTEDVTGEYIFFESTHGNGGYFDGSKTNYFASSLDGNILILENSNWLTGKTITITKLTTTELHITATEASSVENYEMKKR